MLDLEALDGAVGLNVAIDRGFDVGEIGSVGGDVPLGGDAVEQDPFLIGPLTGGVGSEEPAEPLREDGGGHLFARGWRRGWWARCFAQGAAVQMRSEGSDVGCSAHGESCDVQHTRMWQALTSHSHPTGQDE